MNRFLVLVAAMLLTGCSSSAVVCQQWRNKQITDERAAAILGIDPTPVQSVGKDAVTINHSDGSLEKGDTTVIYTSSAIVGINCLGIENGLIEPSMVWTWGK